MEGRRESWGAENRLEVVLKCCVQQESSQIDDIGRTTGPLHGPMFTLTKCVFMPLLKNNTLSTICLCRSRATEPFFSRGLESKFWSVHVCGGDRSHNNHEREDSGESAKHLRNARRLLVLIFCTVLISDSRLQVGQSSCRTKWVAVDVTTHLPLVLGKCLASLQVRCFYTHVQGTPCESI